MRLLGIGGFVTVAASLGIVLAPAAAMSADDPASGWLVWARGEGAESCTGAAEFAARVGAQLGESPGAAARRARRRISVRIERRSDSPVRWSADLTLLADDDSVAGTRRIDRRDDSCGPLGEALVLIAALILAEGPEAGAAAPAPPRPPVQAPPSPPTQPAPPATLSLPLIPAPPAATPALAPPVASSTPRAPAPPPAGPAAPAPPPAPAPAATGPAGLSATRA